MNKVLKPEGGISLRKVFVFIIVAAVLIFAFVFYNTMKITSIFNKMTDVVESHMVLSEAAHELLNASDYLTERVQRFTVNGDRRFMEEYFNEAFEENRREEAISKMSAAQAKPKALQNLMDAFEESKGLMQREYYAMKLVVAAKGYNNYPEALKEVELSDKDKALSRREKMALATEMVLDDEYYAQKNSIRESMKKSLEEIDFATYEAQNSAAANFTEELRELRLVIIFQTIGTLLIVWITAYLGIRPILKAVDGVRKGNPIKESGSQEFRYLAHTYNRMRDAHAKNFDKLKFKALHDELTGLYNRAGYDLVLPIVDLSRTYMMLFDGDSFKEINDTYGHETGDKILIKLASVLKKNFRTDDYICRIGGDEFVVFMVDMDTSYEALVSGKIKRINEELADVSDGLPIVSVSVGIVHGSSIENREMFFEMADRAMYESKKSGKSKHTFYRCE